MKDFLNFVLVIVATLGFSLALFFIILDFVTSFSREDKRDEEESHRDGC